MVGARFKLKQDHQLVTNGIYRHLRHPMYTAFWLMALAPGAPAFKTGVAGLAGIVGFGTLYALRIRGGRRAWMEEALR